MIHTLKFIDCSKQKTNSIIVLRSFNLKVFLAVFLICDRNHPDRLVTIVIHFQDI